MWNRSRAYILGTLAGLFLACVLFMFLSFVASRGQKPIDKRISELSYEYNCSKENIRILQEWKDIHAYRLNVCGNIIRVRYLPDESSGCSGKTRTWETKYDYNRVL